MFSLAVKNSTQNLWRSFLLIIGIAFSVTIMISASVLMDSANVAFRSHFEEDTYHDLEIRSTTSETFSFTPELEHLILKQGYDEINLAFERTLAVSEVFEGYVDPEDAELKVVGFSGLGPEAQEISERFWYSASFSSPVSPQDCIPNYDECIVDADLKFWANPRVGEPICDFVNLNLTPSPILAIVISGTSSSSEGEWATDDLWEAFFNIELLWDSWFPDTRPLSTLSIKLKDWIQVFEAKDKLERLLGEDYSVSVLKSVGEEQIAGIRSYEDALQAVVLIGAAVEFLFVFSQMIVIVFSERRAELSQLRVVGATRLGILRMILIESLLYGIAGSIIGVVIGLYGAVFLTNLLGTYLVGTRVSIVLNIGSIVTGFFYGILITLFAGILPSAYVVYQPPQMGIQSYGRSATQLGTKHSLYFAGIGLLLFFLGLSLLAQVKTTSFMSMTFFKDNALAIGIILMSAIFFEVILIRLLIPLFEKTWRFFPAFVRVLAARSILRAFRRNCAAMITVAVGISFVLTTTTFAASMQKTIPDVLEASSMSEIIMDTGEGNELSRLYRTEILNIDSVKDVGYALGSKLYVESQRSNVVGISADQLYHSDFLRTPTIVDGPSNAFERIAQESSGSPNCIITVTMANELDLRVGKTIQVALTPVGTPNTLRIIATVAPTIFLNNGDNLFVNYDWLIEYSRSIDEVRWFFVATDIPQETYSLLKSQFSSIFHRIIPVFKQIDSVKETLDNQTILFEALLALVMISGLITQGTSYLMAAIEREREVGILRASGSEQPQVLQIFVVEAMMMTFTSILVGLVNAALLSALLFHLGSTTMIPINIVIPFAKIIVWLGIVIIFSYFISRIAFRRIEDMMPAQALRIQNQ